MLGQRSQLLFIESITARETSKSNLVYATWPPIQPKIMDFWRPSKSVFPCTHVQNGSPTKYAGLTDTKKSEFMQELFFITCSHDTAACLLDSFHLCALGSVLQVPRWVSWNIRKTWAIFLDRGSADVRCKFRIRYSPIL